MTDSDAQPRVVIAGGTGFLGQSLARRLTASGNVVVVLGRSRPRAGAAGEFIPWDARTTGGDWQAALDGAAAVVNLAGRTVDCIKTPEHRDEILRSRVESTRAIGAALRAVNASPPVWVQMSTAHIYGDPPEAVCTEDSAFGVGLAPMVGRAWERAFDASCPPGVRRVVLRTSFVLAKGDGAMRRLEMLARIGLGGTIGHGRQGISWIHHLDMNRVLERAIADDSMHGAYIATAPNPVSNAEFMRALRSALAMPIGLPAPAPLVRLGAPLLLRTDPELAIFGRFCVPGRLHAEGFEFAFPTLPEAFGDLYANNRRAPSPNSTSPSAQ